MLTLLRSTADGNQSDSKLALGLAKLAQLLVVCLGRLDVWRQAELLADLTHALFALWIQGTAAERDDDDPQGALERLDAAQVFGAEVARDIAQHDISPLS
jgi:hypothetical protein